MSDEKPARGRRPTPPHLKRVRTKARVPQWLQDWLETQEVSDGELIERALINTYKLKPPA